MSNLPTDAKARKALPLYSGCIRYFPDALLAVAELSLIANNQHNPGEPLHWAKEKSRDELDALMRHLVDVGTLDTDTIRHSAKVAWRALANLQREIERERGFDYDPGTDTWRLMDPPPPPARGIADVIRDSRARRETLVAAAIPEPTGIVHHVRAGDSHPVGDPCSICAQPEAETFTIEGDPKSRWRGGAGK
jgi:hypothetical protein